MWTIVERTRHGGTDGDRGARTFRGRLAELEHSGETVLIEGSDLELRGTIRVSATDHLAVTDEDESEWFVPYQAIWFVIQPRR